MSTASQHPSATFVDRDQSRRSLLESVCQQKEFAMNKSHPLKSIRLQLARSRHNPEGSQNHGCQFVAPLDTEGHIDPEAWKAHRDQCRVRRFWQGEDNQTGRLVHKPGGAEHARWMFDYDPQRDDDDESGYRFGAHKFIPGEYVSIGDERGELHTFRVMSVQPA